MPNTKAAIKQVKVSQKKRLRNKAVRTRNRTLVKKAEALILSGDSQEAEEGVKAAVASLDRAVTKGIVRRNNAARRKSRLMSKLNQAQAEKPA